MGGGGKKTHLGGGKGAALGILEVGEFLLCLHPPLSHSFRQKTKQAPVPRACLRGGLIAGEERDGAISAAELWLFAADEEHVTVQGLKLPGWAVSGGSGGRAEPAVSQSPESRPAGKLQVCSWCEQGGTPNPLQITAS